MSSSSSRQGGSIRRRTELLMLSVALLVGGGIRLADARQSVRGAANTTPAATAPGPVPVPDPAPPTANQSRPQPQQPPEPQQMVNMTLDFQFPYVEGRPIDTCVTLAGEGGCGKPAADMFCRFQRCVEAASYEESSGGRGPTYVQGEAVVRPQGGNSFDLVTCTCLVPAAPPTSEDPAAQIVYNAPQILGHPVDVCMSKKKGSESTCGKPAADAFCQSFGGKESVTFVAGDGPAGEPTWVIGDRAVNQKDPKTFKSITCV